MAERRPLLLCQTGSALPAIASRRGDFPHWFASVLGVAPVVWDAARLGTQPSHSEFSAVVITGSPLMLSQPPSWVWPLQRWVREALVARIPMFGVCFGHQLMAGALGARVGSARRPRELGCVELMLGAEAKDDPMFADHPLSFPVMHSHAEYVLDLPDGVRRLGWTHRDPLAALRFHEQAWSVQFHPEFDANVVRGYIDQRLDALRAEGQDPDRLKRALRPTPWSRRLLRTFARRYA